LTSLKGIEQLTNLRHLYCNNNLLISLKGVEELTKLDFLRCSHNQLSNQYKDYLKTLNIKFTVV